MHRMLLRLLTLAALMLMPFGMPGAMAMAETTPAAAAGSGHCDGHSAPAEEPVKVQVHCNGCSAIAAIEPPAPAAGLRPQAPRLVIAINSVIGIEPEIATPPPKLS